MSHDPQIDPLLQHAVDEAARLLKMDGAMIYLADPSSGVLRFANDAGIHNREARRLIRGLRLPMGTGMFGTAVARAEVMVTPDYPNDQRFAHSEVADRIVEVANMRSMAVAPLIAGGELLGGLGAFSSRPDAFDDAAVGLLRALAGHAASAIDLHRHAEELKRRAETERSLAEIVARITALRDPDAVLQEVVDAAKRLLGSDGAHLTFFSEERDYLRPAVIAGGVDEETRRWMSEQEFSTNEGINGLAATRNEVTWTEHYLKDQRLAPFTAADRQVARRMGLGAMAAAPLRAPEGEAIGSLAVSYVKPRPFRPEELELLQNLADHGAIAITNARLIDQLARSERELARTVEAQRTLGQVARSIVEIADASEVLQRVVDASQQLLAADGAHLTLLADEGDALIPMAAVGISSDEDREWLQTRRFPVGGGMNGLAISEGRSVWTDDYAADPRIPHDPADEVPERLGLGAMAVALLRGASGDPVGTLAVTYRTPRPIHPDDLRLLEELADQGAIAARNARLYEQLAQSERRYRLKAEELAQRAEAQRTLTEIATQISSIRDPSAILRRAIDEAKRLLGAEYAVISLLQAGTDVLIDYRDEGAGLDLADPDEDVPIRLGEGVAGMAVAEGRVVRTGDYLADSAFVHTEAADAWIRDRGFRSMMAAPLVTETGPIGAISVNSRRQAAFGETDAELLGALAGHAAIVLVNARLSREVEKTAEELARRVEAQRTLSEIAARISAIRDPGDLLRRTVEEAARLLAGDGARIDLVDPVSGQVAFTVGHEVGASTDDGTPAESRPDQGVSGRSLAERRVVWTGNYLLDDSFEHAPAIDRYIRRQEIKSLIAAPLVSDDRAIGALIVQSRREDAFDGDDAQLLGALAAQASVAVTNARLYDQLQASERRYRHLVDSSPDVVWSADAEGRFSFFSESLERVTGHEPAALIGLHWSALSPPEGRPAAQAAWDRLRSAPDTEHRLQIDIPCADGSLIPAEISMIANTVDGRFLGATGSIRDVSLRERLERDLRTQAAELAASQERAHLARELHDSVTQALFSMGLTLRTLELLLERDPAAAREKLSELRDLQRDALAEMRTLIFELRPGGLEHDGLPQALRTHAAAVQGRTGLTVTVEAELAHRLPLDVEEALYRIAQEALHNVVKHARASVARVRLDEADGAVRLWVHDDGVGFDPRQVPRGHLGLDGMRQRVERLGGELVVRSQSGGEGTEIEVVVPRRVPAEIAAGASVE